MIRLDKIEALTQAGNLLLRGEVSQAKEKVKREYPFQNLNAKKRTYTDKQKMQ